MCLHVLLKGQGVYLMIKTITYKDRTLAIWVPHHYQAEGIEFFTPDEFSQQLGYMKRSEGYAIPPHVHNPVTREVEFTNEVLFIKSGRVRVDFYDDEHNYLESHVLQSGDVILLAHGGHGFQMLEESEIIEVKQGPYAGEQDKTRFSSAPTDQIRIKEADDE